jgi:hypothetical protein
VSDQVGGWTKRVATKMNQQLEETGELNIKVQNMSLVEVFEEIAANSLKHLDQIIQAKEREEKMGPDANDFVNEFASDDYVKNNIRVRPISGLSRHEESSVAHGMNLHSAGGESDNEDQKYNVDVQHDLEDMRNRIRE